MVAWGRPGDEATQEGPGSWIAEEEHENEVAEEEPRNINAAAGEKNGISLRRTQLPHSYIYIGSQLGPSSATSFPPTVRMW